MVAMKAFVCAYAFVCMFVFLGARVVSKQENKDQGNRFVLERKGEIRGSIGGIEKR